MTKNLKKQLIRAYTKKIHQVNKAMDDYYIPQIENLLTILDGIKEKYDKQHRVKGLQND